MTAALVSAQPLVPPRTSDLLRNVLLNNPNVQVFTVGEILESLGADRTEASLVFFSMPAMVPAPGLPRFSAISTGWMAGQVTIGRKTMHLPKAVLNQKVPRRALAVAIHALVPIIQAAEKMARPRLKWASSPIARRVLGMLLFILAVAIAFPVIGFDPLHAASISVISLGLAEQDGLAILLGAMAGLISLALIVTSGLTAKILKSKVVRWIRKLARRAGADALAAVCDRRGWAWLAAVLRFDWQDMLLMWDPERRESERQERARQAAPRPEPATSRRPSPRGPERRGASRAQRGEAFVQPLTA